MPLVRVPVAGTIGKAVRINTDATIGAQIGVNLLLPDGSTPSLKELACALYAAKPPEFTPLTSSGTVGPVSEDDIIDGNIYVRIADDEIITGTYDFIKFHFREVNEEKISLFGNRLGLSTSFGIGTQPEGASGSLFFKTPGEYRWFRNTAVLTGTPIMRLAPTLLEVNASHIKPFGVNSPALAKLDGSPTVPNILVNFTDKGSGIGSGGGNNAVHVIAGNVNAVNYFRASTFGVRATYNLRTGIGASITQTQAGATVLSNEQYIEVTTVVNDNDAVKLGAAATGVKTTLVNSGAKILQIFPTAGDDLGKGVDVSMTLAAGRSVTFFALDATNWQISDFGGPFVENTLDGAANETITGDWTFTGAGTVYNGIAAANLLDKSANEAISGSYTFNGLTFYTATLRMDNTIRLKGLNAAASVEFDIAQVSSGDNVIFGDAAVLTRIRGTSVSVDAALTATSYNGILAANLLDKTAAETITESWIWSGSADTITFTGGGPFGIQFRSVQSTTAQQIDLVYRTSPDTLAFERTSDAVKIIEINAATLAVDFAGAITAASYDGILAANLLDKVAAETIAGAYTITGGLTLTTNNLVAGTIDADFDDLTVTTIGTGLGTVALPSRFFEGDPDTGSFSPGANIYAISVGGTEAVRYTGSSAPLIRTGMNSGITASTTQTQGEQPLTASWNEVAVVANNNDVVTLPVGMTTGEMCVVINSSAKKLQVFPASGKDCGAGIDTSLTIKGNSSRFWFSYDNTVAFDIATDFEKLQNINVIGKSANDLLYFDGTDWTHTDGGLTWDGVTLTAVRLKSIKYMQHRTASTANLEDITNAVNTSGGKIQGAEVYNRDTDNPVYATGSSDGSVWVDGIGTTVHTPV